MFMDAGFAVRAAVIIWAQCTLFVSPALCGVFLYKYDENMTLCAEDTRFGQEVCVPDLYKCTRLRVIS